MGFKYNRFCQACSGNKWTRQTTILHCRITCFTGIFRIVSGAVTSGVLRISLVIGCSIQLVGNVINHKCGSGQRCGTGDHTGKEITKLAHKTLLVGILLLIPQEARTNVPASCLSRFFKGVQSRHFSLTASRTAMTTGIHGMKFIGFSLQVWVKNGSKDHALGNGRIPRDDSQNTAGLC